MNSDKDGGPAFPYSERHLGQNMSERITAGGMTLRDYFAAKAMSAAMRLDDLGNMGSCEHVAEFAYAHADAMLKARKS